MSEGDTEKSKTKIPIISSPNLFIVKFYFGISQFQCNEKVKFNAW